MQNLLRTNFFKQSCKLGSFFLIIFWWLTAASLPPQIQSLAVESPLPFGYSIGDLIDQKIKVSVIKPFTVMESQLPRIGPINSWLELRGIDLIDDSTVTHSHYRIELRYQVFKLVKKTETLKIPGWSLQIFSDESTRQIPIPDWKFSYGPLIPTDTVDKDVQIRPGSKPQQRPIGIRITILIAALVGFASVLSYFGFRNDLLPFIRKNPSPFAKAYRKLKKLDNSAGDDPASYRAALRIFHHALDETAGKAIFANHLDLFFSTYPAFENLRAETTRFFATSSNIFFVQGDGTQQADYSISRLQKLCHRYRALER